MSLDLEEEPASRAAGAAAAADTQLFSPPSLTEQLQSQQLQHKLWMDGGLDVGKFFSQITHIFKFQ